MSALEIPLFIASAKQISSKRLTMTIYKCFVIVSLFYVVISLTPIAHRYKNEYGTFQAGFLTLGYENPNKTGMLLFACTAVLLSYFYRVNSIGGKNINSLGHCVYVVLDLSNTISCKHRCRRIIIALLIHKEEKSHRVLKLGVLYRTHVFFTAALTIISKNRAVVFSRRCFRYR